MELKPDAFDPILHSGPRITIMSRVLIQGPMRFAALQRSTGLTAGNLAAHLKVLQDAGFVVVREAPRAVRIQKRVEATAEGERAFRDYIQRMREILHTLDQATLAPDVTSTR